MSRADAAATESSQQQIQEAERQLQEAREQLADAEQRLSESVDSSKAAQAKLKEQQEAERAKVKRAITELKRGQERCEATLQRCPAQHIDSWTIPSMLDGCRTGPAVPYRLSLTGLVSLAFAIKPVTPLWMGPHLIPSIMQGPQRCQEGRSRGHGAVVTNTGGAWHSHVPACRGCIKVRSC